MNEAHLEAALRDYGRALRTLEPPEGLDARLAASIARVARARARSQRRWRQAGWWAVAASLVTLSAAVLVTGDRPAPGDTPGARDAVRATAPPLAHGPTPVGAAAPWGGGARDHATHSPFPVEAAVFRVRGRLATDAARADGVGSERQFWVDVRLASDGSMRIVDVIPAYE